MEAAHRSIHPNIPGVPWWAALLIATTATAIGYAIDAGSGHKELTHVFAGLYIAGCVVAVLAVRQSGVFTAVIQPPLILFCAVPGAYWLFHGGKVGNLKDLLINCGYPLIERFPLMLGTAGGVLLIGLIRWYFGLITAARRQRRRRRPAPRTTETKSVISGIAAKLASILRPRRRRRRGRGSVRRRRAGQAVERRSRPARSSRSAATTRPNPLPAFSSPAGAGRTKRRPSGRPEAAVAPRPPATSTRPSRPVGRAAARGRRATPTRRPAAAGKAARPRRASQSLRAAGRSRLRSLRRLPRPVRASYEPYEPPRRRAPNGAGPTHHPISQVRYRGSAPRDERRDPYDDEPRAERRSRSRTPGRSQGRPPAESWEYDV